MAEAAGLVIGGVGLVALFDSGMSAFEYIESGAHYGRDYNKAVLKVSCNQLRLTQWKASVELVDDPAQGTPGLPVAPPEQVAKVRELLQDINDGFEDAERIAQRHSLTQNQVSSDQQDGAQTATALTTTVRSRALVRQGKSSLKQKALWALRDQKKLGRLIDDQKDSITSLVDLFPAIGPQQLALAKREADVLSNQSGPSTTSEGRSMLVEATDDVYPELSLGLREATSGNQYRNVTSMKEARQANGDYFAKDYNGPISSHRNTFDNVRADDKSQQLNGNNYGGKHVFDD